jgi:3-oxoacyl-[acyl-carrier protein] reductase
MGLLDGKVALVTGGSRGIGRAIALQLGAEGADVAFTYRERADKAQEVVDELESLGARSRAFQVDVSDFASAQLTVDELASAWGHLDILVNNAGIHQNEAIWAMEEAQWDEVLEVNLKGTFNYIRAVAPGFREQGAGRIINIASIHGLRGRAAGPNYSAAKAGVIGLTKSVARDLGPYGVTVNAVAPGIVETDMVRELPKDRKASFVAQIVMGRIGQPEDVAHLVAFLASDRARHITGEVIKVDGGQYI